MFGATAAKTRLFHLHGRYACIAVHAAQFMGSRNVVLSSVADQHQRAVLARWLPNGGHAKPPVQDRPAVQVATGAGLAVLAPPREQIGREVGGGTTLAWSTRRQR